MLTCVGVLSVQLGASWFDTVAKELSGSAYGVTAADTFFHQVHDKDAAASDRRQWAARAVMVDMEPKVLVGCMGRTLGLGMEWAMN